MRLQDLYFSHKRLGTRLPLGPSGPLDLRAGSLAKDQVAQVPTSQWGSGGGPRALTSQTRSPSLYGSPSPW